MNEEAEMKRLEINLSELAYATEDALGLNDYYLDLETGKIVMISDETRWELEQLYEENHDPEAAAAFDLAEVLRQSNMHEWQQQVLLEADRVEQEYLSRYISVPHATSHEGYGDMEDFILTVPDQRLQSQLWDAIRGRGAFRRFKDVLADHPRERERWFGFKDELMQQRVVDWLNSAGIEPVFAPRPVPERPSMRPKFMEEVLIFVRAASKLAGVTRIALIGSLTTDEPDPRDVDMLVMVTDGADLVPLATLGRQLNGHLQQVNRGGEVFLADPQGNYLGRTCPWKRCGPGIRLSCEALHCGRRPYLHDDLETIRLAKELILALPLELWPQVAARGPVPADIEQNLITLLRRE